MKTIAKNLTRKSKGKRYSEKDNTDFKDLLEVTLILGGPSLCSFVSEMLGGAHVETVKDWFKTNSVEYDFKKMENNVKFIAHIYKLCKEKIS